MLVLVVFASRDSGAQCGLMYEGRDAPAKESRATDDQYSIDTKAASVYLDVLSNDSETGSSENLMIVASGQTKSGGQLVNNVSHLTYVPAHGFSGTDKFTYTIVDQSGAASTASVTVKQMMTWRIMPIGDSITEASGSRNSYRRPLWHLLNDAGIDVNFVGSRNGNRDGQVPNPDFDSDHEGHWGWRADRFLQNNRIDGWAQTHQPDVALIHLGTNDIFQDQSVSGTINEIGDIIDRLRSVNPDIIVLLAQIIPTSDPGRPSLAAFNQAIPGLASSKNTQRSPVVVVDQSSGFNAAADTYDGVHPNLVGETKIANKWHAALLPLISVPTTVDLAVSRNPESPISHIGEDIQVVFSVQNNGTANATDVELHVTIPADTELVSEPLVTNGATCSISGTSVVCEDDLNPGAGFDVTIELQLTTTGVFTLSAEARSDQVDANNSNNDAGVEITIENRAPVLIEPIPDVNIVVGSSYMADVSTYFSDQDNESLTFVVDVLPGGFSLDGSTGLISGTPTDAGSTIVNLTAADSAGATLTEVFVISVSEAPAPPPLPPPPPPPPPADRSTSTDASGGGSISILALLCLLYINLRRRKDSICLGSWHGKHREIEY